MGLRPRFESSRRAQTHLDKPATERQVNALLVSLSVNKIIDCRWEHGNHHYDMDGAIEWVNQNMSFTIETLDDLTHGQIGMCFKELDGGE